LPVYAECGGLMYLCRSLADPEGRCHEMVGLVPARAVLRGRRVTLGYVEARARGEGPVLAAGEVARGHEFHLSVLEEPLPTEYAAYELADGRAEGFLRDNLLASYVHLHFASNPCLAPNLVAACGRTGGALC
jgi:cobyrinic acid a,c-diamide synthase